MTTFVVLMIVFFTLLAIIPIAQARVFALNRIREMNELIRRGNFHQAKKIVNNLPSKLKNRPDVLYAQYLINTKQNNHRMAIYYLDEIERMGAYDESINITQPSVNLMKTEIYETIGDKDGVIRTCRQIIKNDTKNLNAHEKISLHLCESGNYEEALPYLERCETLGSKNSDVYKAYAELLGKRGENEKALKMVEKAIGLYKGKNCRLMEMRVLFLYRNNQPRAALEYADEIDTIYKKSIETKAVVGLCFYETGSTREALRRFSSILDKHLSVPSPEIAKARLVYSTLLLKEKKLNEAISQLDMIDRAGAGTSVTAEARKIMQILSEDKSLKDIFVNNIVGVAQKVITDSINWKKFLQEAHKSPNSNNDIILLRETNSTNKSFCLFWFYLQPAVITAREAEAMYLEIESMIGNVKKDVSIYYCSLFRPEESTIKLLVEHKESINFICGEDLLFRLKSRKLQ